ncbi:AmmeMemoRadiSam system protein A [Thioalkalicoccus limnaeus]|uniref:AmmeMemoRadiSam system protein A n=1 Tax=Thioalkalicoccus limnaeus TaxID=120681 RepID=A0ABV4BFM4_9GAMM
MSSIDQRDHWDDPDGSYDPTERALLLDLAIRAMERGLRQRDRWEPALDDHPDSLRAHRASFVTLTSDGRLRGCIGSLRATRPLGRDVARNAYAAAFEDPRFPPLAEAEFAWLEVQVSVLSPPQPMTFGSRRELLAQIRPGIDGLILEAGNRQGTFLPSVWEQLNDREQFLEHLIRKAGLPPGYWSEQLTVSRYTTESFARPVSARP